MTRATPRSGILAGIGALLAACMLGPFAGALVGASTYAPPASGVLIAASTAHTTHGLLSRIALEYGVGRPDLRMTVSVSKSSDPAVSSTLVAFNALAKGEVDFAVALIVPTEAQKAATPDLAYFPIWATAFTIAVNIPEVGLTKVVLSMQVAARIFTGQITWSVCSAHRHARRSWMTSSLRCV
jgi:ABC-type phosphate transport system substrate-binding protein